jgi:hypothetical protein
VVHKLSLFCMFEVMALASTGNSILKGSDNGVLYLIKPRFWTLSIVSGYKNTTSVSKDISKLKERLKMF